MKTVASVRTRLAAIDIGSNSIRLVVAETDADGGYRVLDEERDMARLGKGLAGTGRLQERPMKAALAALAKMKAIAGGFKARIRAVATSAVRDSANGKAFRSLVRKRLGLHLEIVSGEEEGLLAFRSAARHFDLGGKSVAVVDIGGGSMEVVFSRGPIVERVASLPLGAVRLTEELPLSNPPKNKEWKRLRREIDRTIKKGVGRPPFDIQVMVGSGGTFNAIAKILKAECEGTDAPGSVQGYLFSRDDMGKVLDRLRKLSLAERRRVPGLNPKRADIILAGMAALSRLAKSLDVGRIVVNEGGIRDGILLGMIARLGRGSSPKPRSRWKDRIEAARTFARACHSRHGHCEHVAKLAVSIFDALQAAHKLPLPGREILQLAALLHDVGYLVNHERHREHAYHLILHSNLAGYSAKELELIANVVRYQHGAMPKNSHPNLKRLSNPGRKLVKRLSAILRLANALDRAHAQRVSALSIKLSPGHARLLVQARTSPEVELWDAARQAGAFEKVFGRRLGIAWRRLPAPERERTRSGSSRSTRRVIGLRSSRRGRPDRSTRFAASEAGSCTSCTARRRR